MVVFYVTGVSVQATAMLILIDAAPLQFKNTQLTEFEEFMPRKSLLVSETVNDASISPEARDGNIAILEEFQAALDGDGIKKLELFVKRHPDHVLSAQAVIEIEKRQN